VAGARRSVWGAHSRKPWTSSTVRLMAGTSSRMAVPQGMVTLDARRAHPPPGWRSAPGQIARVLRSLQVRESCDTRRRRHKGVATAPGTVAHRYVKSGLELGDQPEHPGGRQDPLSFHAPLGTAVAPRSRLPRADGRASPVSERGGLCEWAGLAGSPFEEGSGVWVQFETHESAWRRDAGTSGGNGAGAGAGRQRPAPAPPAWPGAPRSRGVVVYSGSAATSRPGFVQRSEPSSQAGDEGAGLGEERQGRGSGWGEGGARDEPWKGRRGSPSFECCWTCSGRHWQAGGPLRAPCECCCSGAARQVAVFKGQGRRRGEWGGVDNRKPGRRRDKREGRVGPASVGHSSVVGHDRLQPGCRVMRSRWKRCIPVIFVRNVSRFLLVTTTGTSQRTIDRFRGWGYESRLFARARIQSGWALAS